MPAIRQKGFCPGLPGPLYLQRGLAIAAATLLVSWNVRDRRRDFSLPGHEVAHHFEDRDQEDQRKSTADDPNGNLDRKRVCDADGVAKNVDQFFHIRSPQGQRVQGGLV